MGCCDIQGNGWLFLLKKGQTFVLVPAVPNSWKWIGPLFYDPWNLNATEEF